MSDRRRDPSWRLRIAGVAALTLAIVGLGWVYIGQDHSITRLEHRKPAAGLKGDQGRPGEPGTVVVVVPTTTPAPARSGATTATTRPPATTTTTGRPSSSTTSTSSTTTTQPCTTLPAIGRCL